MTAAQARACAPWYRVLLMGVKLQRTVGDLQPPLLGPRTAADLLELETLLERVVAQATRLVRAAEEAAGVTPGGGVAEG
jgi:hypothetical protein